MEEQKIKTILKDTFNAVSGGYDNKSLRFFPASAAHMASLLCLRGDEQVLDVACGTGHATLEVARLLSGGRVTAVDFSPGMLEQARQKASRLNINNVSFLERDMHALGFPERTFDAAICAFGIFFVKDMTTQLSHIASTVRPGGRVMITSFQESYFQPLRDLFFNRLAQYGVQSPSQAWKTISNEAGCRELFAKAGLTDIRVEMKNVGYYLDSAGQWWDVVWNAGFRRMVSQLKPDDQARFKLEHLREVEALRKNDGIWLDVGVLFTTGTKPGRN